MPSAFYYVAPTDIARQSLNGALASEKTSRRREYQTALEYYEGKHPSQLDFEAGETDDNVIINLVKQAADRTATFLFPDVPNIEIDPESIEDTPEETYVKEFFDQNGGLSNLIKLALRGFLSGHCFVRIKHTDVQKRNHDKPTMSILDPTSVTAFWRADDIGEILWYEMRYQVGGTVRLTDFVRKEVNEGYQWEILTYEGQSQNNTFDKINDIDTPHGRGNYGYVSLDHINFTSYNWKLIDKAVHTHAIPPIIEFAHLPNPDSYYGSTEFSQKGLQDTINRIISIMNKISRQNSDPIDVIVGADADAIENEGSIVSIPDAAAKIQRLEMKGDLGAIGTVLNKLIETSVSG